MDNVKGFTLLEMMIVIAIIGVLISIALPSYKYYIQKAHFSEIIQAAAPFKIGVEECYQITSQLSDCQSGRNGIPGDINNGPGLINSITVKSGIIKASPKVMFGFQGSDTLILTPEIKHNILTWKKTGGAVKHGLIR